MADESRRKPRIRKLTRSKAGRESAGSSPARPAPRKSSVCRRDSISPRLARPRPRPDAEDFPGALAARRLWRGRKIRSSGIFPSSPPSRRQSSHPISIASPPGRATTTNGRGLDPRSLIACQPRDEARFVVLHSYDGYTTNLALEDFAAEDALLAHTWSGAPLEAEHGGPVRLVVPHLYFWKSAKWLQASNSSIETRRAIGRSAAIITAAIRGPSSAIPATDADLPSRIMEPNMPTERFQFTGRRASNWRPRWICRSASRPPTRCSRIASPAARTGWRPNASRSHSRQRASRCCGSTSRALAPAKAISPIRPFPPTSPISCAPPTICGNPKGACDPDRPQPRRRRDSGRGRANSGCQGRRHHRRPSDPAHVTGLFADRIEDIRKRGEVEVSLAGRPSTSSANSSTTSPNMA